MDRYIDITILPDPEFSATILLNSLYTKLHKALCDLRSTDIGVSFPNYQLTPGDILRIHGSEEALEKLQRLSWVGSMSSYCQQSSVISVPPNAKFRIVSRKQPTMSPAKLKRLIKRGSITEEQAKGYKAKMHTKGLESPYVKLVSGSSGHRHRRYLEFGPLSGTPAQGHFDQFGLSKTATVPWF